MDLCGKERCEKIAEYVIETGATVRATAKIFGISKSTVHKDITEKLKYYHSALYGQIRKIMEKNKEERHLRGGEATRQKYINEKTKPSSNPST